MAEARDFNKSTYSLLDEVPLLYVGYSGSSSTIWDQGYSAEEGRRWVYLMSKLEYGTSALMPVAGTPYAFWAVNEPTGTVIGVLDDLTGGGSTEQIIADINARFDPIIIQLALLSEAASGSMIGLFAGLEKTKVEALKKATIVIATMGDVDIDPRDIVSDTLCSYAKSGLGAVSPPTAKALGLGIESKYELAKTVTGISGPTMLPCPW